jgi:hypothetical protein
LNVILYKRGGRLSDQGTSGPIATLPQVITGRLYTSHVPCIVLERASCGRRFARCRDDTAVPTRDLYSHGSALPTSLLSHRCTCGVALQYRQDMVRVQQGTYPTWMCSECLTPVPGTVAERLKLEEGR